MDDLLADFIAETREMLEASQSEIIAWEANPQHRLRLDAIFRFVHTVKGNCGFFDFARLERLSHAAEDALADVRGGARAPDAALVSAVLAVIDRISAMVDAIEAGEDFPEGDDEALIARLEQPDMLGTHTRDEDAVSDAGMIGSPAPAAGASPNLLASARTIRLPTQLLDRVMSGVSDMVLARNDLAHRLQMSGAEPTIDGPFERLTAILNDVRDAVTRMRMQRIEHLFSMFPRLVRDLSKDLGKQVMIDMEGGDVELDREMIEMIRDPLTHIIRNALDHGIETPAERLKAGKREIGLVSLAARQSGNKISIVISDDGRGLDAERIAAKALEAGIVTQSQLRDMPREAVLQLVFEPGLSTAETISSVSGRGVGLDVVRDNFERIGGTIKVSSTVGVGSLFYLTIPLTLSIITGVTVEVGQERFAIPRSYIEEIVQLDADHLDYTLLGARGVITFRGKRIPCLSLADVLGLEHATELEDRNAAIVRLASGDVIALLVDDVNNITDLVVKPLPPVIMQCELYGGSTQLDDGVPILLLDIPLIAQQQKLLSDTRAPVHASEPVASTAQSSELHAMVFAGFDGRRRALRLDLIQRIETVPLTSIDRSGSSDRVVIDGVILPLAGLTETMPEQEALRFLRLSDGDSHLAYAIAQVEDAVLIEGGISPAPGEDLAEGNLIIDEAPVVLMDGFALFARYGQAERQGPPLTCRLPDNEWARTILAPLVTGCGYVVVEASAAGGTDIAITMADEDHNSTIAAKVIRLHDEPGAAGSEDNGVYRYDRTRLIAELKQARNVARTADHGATDGAAA